MESGRKWKNHVSPISSLHVLQRTSSSNMFTTTSTFPIFAFIIATITKGPRLSRSPSLFPIHRWKVFGLFARQRQRIFSLSPLYSRSFRQVSRYASSMEPSKVLLEKCPDIKVSNEWRLSLMASLP